jgi:endonuclease/exonuclease/phosphatase family metal-dependent hydrolase
MLTVLTYNVFNGGPSREATLDRVIRSAQPDIVLLQELSDGRLLERLAGSLRAACFLARGRGHGHVGIISRFPIASASTHRGAPLRVALLEASVALPSNQHLRIWGVHLAPYFGLPFEIWRAAELRTILGRARLRQEELGLIAGDFNAIAPGDEVLVRTLPLALRAVVFAHAGHVDRWALRAPGRHGWVDCYRRVHPDATGWTMPSDRPNARIDYVFASPALASRLRECSVVADPPQVRDASDHLPVRAVFDLD